MKVGGIVQARMSSQRLPGKVLRPVNGKPLLQFLLERLVHAATLDTFVIATSIDESDTPIAELCGQLQVHCFRGDLGNVAQRFLDTLDIYMFDVFVRVNGDSPLLDQRLIDRGVTLLLEGGYDLITNVMPRSYPPGQSVEVIQSSAFREACRQMSEAGDFEHVTRYFYKNPDQFKLRNFASPIDYSGIHLAVDTGEDLRVFETLVEAMDRPHWEYTVEEIVHLYHSTCNCLNKAS